MNKTESMLLSGLVNAYGLQRVMNEIGKICDQLSSTSRGARAEYFRAEAARFHNIIIADPPVQQEEIGLLSFGEMIEREILSDRQNFARRIMKEIPDL